MPPFHTLAEAILAIRAALHPLDPYGNFLVGATPKPVPAPPSTLETLVAEELDIPVDPSVTALAEAIAARHGAAARAVLFYGSCLREKKLDEQMLDFYLIVSDYRSTYRRRWRAVLNWLLPPNVFAFEKDGLTAKYAVLSEAHLERLASAKTFNVSVWARFAQPSRLVWVSDEAARARTVASIAQAAPTLLSAAMPALSHSDDPLDLWRGAFALTYRAELRSERKSRGPSVVDADPERYRAFTPAVLAEVRPMQGRWRLRAIQGKALTLARLAKASFTFPGGIDYLIWKINRHAGTAIKLKPWQRRLPMLGAISLLPRLLRSGAIR